MPPTNRAAWLMAKQSPVYVVDVAPYTPPSANEVVIKTKAIAINPADVKLQKLGILLTDYPAIMGCDVAGEVVEVHPSLAHVYSIGDRVMGHGGPLVRKDGTFCYATFQEYVVLRAHATLVKLPKHVAYEDATVLPLGIRTAASCMFMDETLGLKWPSAETTTPGQGKTVLIWGASSSVGSCGVQLATHAGYEVIGVASKRNHEMVKSLGASACFDQSDPTLVDDIVESLKGKAVVGAFDAVASGTTLQTLCEIIDRCGERKMVVAVRPGAEKEATRGVTITTNFAVAVRGNEVPKVIWQWVAKAMEDNTIKYMPQAEVVGRGLEDLQKAVDLLAQGVSAKKLVVSI